MFSQPGKRYTRIRMTSRTRRSLAACVLFGTLVAGSIWTASGQSAGELENSIRQMQQLLRDLQNKIDQLERTLKQLERRRKELAKEEKRRARPPSSPQPPATTASSHPVPHAAPSQEALRAERFAKAQADYRKGREAQLEGDCATAIQWFTAALEGDPKNDPAYLHRGLCRQRLGQTAEAIQDLNQSLKIQPENAEAYAIRAQLYLFQQQPDAAAADWEQAAIRSGKPEHLLSMAQVMESQGKTEQLLQSAMRVLHSQALPPAALLRKAAEYRGENQLALALAAANLALAADPNLLDAYTLRANLRVRMNQLEGAMEDLRQAIRVDPGAGPAVAMLRALEQQAGVTRQPDPTGAAVPPASANAPLPTTASQPDPSPEPVPPLTPAPATPDPPSTAPPVAAPTGMSIQTPPPSPVEVTASRPAAGKSKPVLTPASTPLVAPINPARAREARRLIFQGRKLSEQMRFAEAIETLSRALELDPQSALAFNSRGFAYLKAGRYPQAIQDFESAIRLDSRYANASWNLGVTLKLTGQREAGLGYMQKAAELQRDAYAGLLSRQLRSR
jgi:tetratricopeptide (TPR) repeat protein